MKDLLHIEGEFLGELGVVDWGYTEEATPKSFDRFESWVEKGNHGPLGYLSDHRKDLRKSLESVKEDFQSALVFLFTYAPEKAALEKLYQSEKSNGLKVAGYSVSFEGNDYHYKIKEKLEEIGKTIGKPFKISLDIQPVLERDLAYRSGLGWFGKNSMLINRKKGSFNMIGALLFEEKLPISSREPETDHCGQCTACFDICPTDAIDLENRQIIANKCISTFTIELFKDNVAPKGYNDVGEIFGCDLCQDVCPWNKRMDREEEYKIDSNWPSFSSNELVDFFLTRPPIQIKEELEAMSNKAYVRKFKGTSFERTGRLGLLKNLKKFFTL